jgi:hypothetical protein
MTKRIAATEKRCERFGRAEVPPAEAKDRAGRVRLPRLRERAS